MARTHGIGSTYRAGCRCRPCTDANARIRKGQRKRSGERMSSDPAAAVHGRASTYTNWCCRCELCKEAHARFMAELKSARTARLAADPSLAPHGRASTYHNWGCRCRPCTDAHAQDDRGRNARRRTRAEVKS